MIALRIIPTSEPTARPEREIVTSPIVKAIAPAVEYAIPI